MRMGVNDRAEKIDRLTVANELMKFGELEACRINGAVPR